MLHSRIPESNLLLDSHPFLTVGERLYNTDDPKKPRWTPTKLGGVHIATKECRVEKPNGDLLFMLIKDVIPQSVWRPAYELLRTVHGSLANRPDIIGANLRMPGVNKAGQVSNFNTAPKAIVDAFGGTSDLLGYYKYKNPAPGVVDCAPTAWTEGETDILVGCMDFINAVDEVYRTMLPAEYANQLKIVGAVPKQLRMYNTAFTTLYVLKNAPTAVHTDTSDAMGTFGCMASLGENWQGNELVFPKFRIGADYRPGDVILADVHEWHTNLPLLSGERVAEKTTDGITAPHVVWGETTDKDANAVMALVKESRDGKNQQIDKARLFLPMALEKGPRLARELFNEAKAEGISEQQLKRAKYELGNVQTSKRKDGWIWYLPGKAQEKNFLVDQAEL
ncbi:MAG: hypothetical protein WB711_12845 [Terriglobales bacterium]